jgi:hypothetical protein
VGTSLPSSAEAPAPSSPETASDLAQLKESWIGIKAKVTRPRGSAESETPDAAMDIVFQIEQVTRKQCGKGSGVDEALRLLADNHSEVDR